MPLPVISVVQMREWEKATWAAGQTEAEVIRRVGKAVAQHALQLARPGDLILILAGKGNNGADARAATEHLRERRAELLDVKNPETDFEKLSSSFLSKPKLIIDGLFGIGINRRLDEDWGKFITAINRSKIPVLAVDVPSGLNAETGEPEGAAIEAEVTLTVGAPKTGMLRQSAWQFVGRLEVASDVGLVPCPHGRELNWTLPADFFDFPPRRPAAGHKGNFGHVAIVAGSLGYHGASVLASRGAQRAQPGLITLIAQDAAFQPAAAQLQAVMVRPWSGRLDLPGKFSSVLIGPGLAAPHLPEEIKNLTRQLWSEAPVPVIVDASALDWLSPGATPPETIRVVTPHPGEAARLLNSAAQEIQADRPRALEKISKKFGGCFVVLKGHQSLVGRAGGKIFANSSGNPFLAQGGTGDVLAGFLAGLLAQRELQADPLKTIRFAVWAHGAAADRLSRELPNWAVEDLIESLGM